MGVLYTLTSRINQSISIQHATSEHLFDCTEGVKTRKKNICYGCILPSVCGVTQNPRITTCNKYLSIRTLASANTPDRLPPIDEALAVKVRMLHASSNREIFH